MNNPRTVSGFSLVETLVAMVIFILAVGVLAEAANNTLWLLNLMEVKEGRENDYAFVRDQILVKTSTDDLFVGGEVETPDAGRAKWSVGTETTNTPDLFKLDLSITLPGEGDIPGETSNETIYVLRPQWSKTEDRASLLDAMHGNLSNVRTNQAWP
jgi:hypothetical protein